MFKVYLVLLTRVSCEILGEPSLNFDSNTEYASKYHNYVSSTSNTSTQTNFVDLDQKPRDYHFNYGVSDPHTGDHKAQWEVKENGVVRGGYSLLEPDGTTRIVEYIADDDGFRAVVKKLGTSLHPEHVESHGVNPISVVQPEQPQAYHAYDGHADNYANVLGAALQHLNPISYIQPIEIPHNVELHGYNQHLKTPSQYQIEPLHYEPIEQQEDLPYLSTNINQAYLAINPIQNQQTSHSSGIHEDQGLVQPARALGYAGVPDYILHGTTGNVEDGSQYSNYHETSYGGYHGEYSEKVHRVVPFTQNQQPLVKNSQHHQKFVIYYPEHE